MITKYGYHKITFEIKFYLNQPTIGSDYGGGEYGGGEYGGSEYGGDEYGGGKGYFFILNNNKFWI